MSTPRRALIIIDAQQQYFEGTGLLEWLRAEDVDTITLTGYMTNNCVLASAVAAEPQAGTTLPRSNLAESAMAGRAIA